MPRLKLEDIEGEVYDVVIPKYPSARVKNDCEAAFNAYVKATGSGEEGAIDNAMQALSEQKNIVVEWLNENWFDHDLGPERLAPPSQDKIMVEYAPYIEGMQVSDETKKKVEKEKEES